MSQIAKRSYKGLELDLGSLKKLLKKIKKLLWELKKGFIFAPA
jgi:hypothetical protein